MIDEVKLRIFLLLVIDWSFVVTYKQLVVAYDNEFCYWLYVRNLNLWFIELTLNLMYINSEEIVEALNPCYCQLIFLGYKKELFISWESD